MQQRRSRSARAIIPVIVVLALLVLITLSIRNWMRTSRAGEELLVVSGTVEARYTRLASQLGGRIIELTVEEGAAVSKDELIFRTDPLDLPMQLEQAQQAIANSQARLWLLQAGPTPEEISAARHRAAAARSAFKNLQLGSRMEEIAAARNEADVIRARIADARDDLHRLELLFASAVIEERRLVAARNNIITLEESLAASENRVALLEAGPRDEEIEQARQQAEAAQSDYERVLRGSRAEEIQAAEASLAGLFAAKDAAQVHLDETEVYSPVDGEIVNLPVNPGDILSPGQTVCEILLPDSIYIQTFIPENRLAWISLGSRLEYSMDGVSGSALATVTYISPAAEFTPRNLQTTEKRVEQVYRVKLQPAADSRPRPGLICDIRIPAPEGSDGQDG